MLPYFNKCHVIQTSTELPKFQQTKCHTDFSKHHAIQILTNRPCVLSRLCQLVDFQGSNTGFWHQTNNENSNQAASYSTGDGSLEEKRQRLLQHQSLTLETHRQLQQGVMNMASQMYNMAQQQQQGMWAGGNYNAPNWNASGGDSSGFQGYTGDQYGNWYQQQ